MCYHLQIFQSQSVFKYPETKRPTEHKDVTYEFESSVYIVKKKW